MSKIDIPVTLSVHVGIPSETDIPITVDASSIPDAKVAKNGDLFQVQKQDTDPETDDVRMIGIVSKPEVPDSEGSVISAQEIRQANDLFMREFGTIGFMHQKSISDKVKIVQNVIAPTDIDYPVDEGKTQKIAKGTWYQELWTDDPELVGKIRKGEITGLSIGGFAKRVPVDAACDDDPKKSMFHVERNMGKSETMTKAEGDPVRERLVDLRVEEVSLVDAAANEEVFLVVKRKPADAETEEDEMKTEDKVQEEVVAAEEEVTKSEDQETETDGAEEEVTKSEEDGEAEGSEESGEVDAGEVAGEEVEEGEGTLEEPVTKSDEPNLADVLKVFGDRLDSIEKKLDDQAKKVDKVEKVRAVAKGEAVPSSTVKVEKEQKQESVWAGTVVHRAVRERSNR